MAGAVALLPLVVLIDTVTDQGIAVGMINLIPVFLTLWVPGRTPTYAISVVVTASIILGFFLSPAGSQDVGIINRSIGIGLVAITTWFVISRKTDEDRIVRSNRDLEQANRDLVALERVAGVTISTLDLRSLAHTLLESLVDVTGADAAVLMLREDDVLTALSGVGFSEEELKGYIVGFGESFAGRAATAMKPVYLEDAQAVPYVVPFLKERGFRTLLGMPLIDGSKNIGMLGLYWKTVRPRSERELGLLQIASEKGAVAITNAILHERTKEEERFSSALTDLQSVIISSLRFNDIMTSVAVDGCKGMGSDACLIAFREQGEWEIRFVSGHPGEMVGVKLPSEKARAIEQAAARNKVMMAEDASSDPIADQEHIQRFDIRSYMMVPVAVRGEVIAVLSFDYIGRSHRFSQAERTFANRLAGFVSLAIENSRAFAREQEAHLEAELEHRRLRTILDTLPVGVFIADSSGRITEVNSEVERIWGGRVPMARSVLDYQEYHGWWAETGEPVLAHQWGLARAVQKGEVSIGEVIDIERFDGTRGTILDSASPIFSDGRVVGAVVVVQDITQQREVTKELQDAKRRAELYIDLLTHDINNLNAAAIGYLQLVEGSLPGQEKTVSWTRKALDSLESSTRLIDTVSKVQKVVSERDERTDVDLGLLLERVTEGLEGTPGRDITVHIEPPRGWIVRASELIEEAFSNVIGNAVKHSRGPLDIWVEATVVEEEGRPFYRVDIADSGPGIPDDQKGRVFSRRERGTTHTAGHGLGLYLARSLVEGTGGRIWVEDRVPGDHTKGARFVILLPPSQPSERARVRVRA